MGTECLRTKIFVWLVGFLLFSLPFFLCNRFLLSKPSCPNTRYVEQFSFELSEVHLPLPLSVGSTSICHDAQLEEIGL